MIFYGTLSVLLVLGVLAFERGGNPPHGTHLVAAVAYLNAAVAVTLAAALSEALTGLWTWIAALCTLVFLCLAAFRLFRFRQAPRSHRRR